MSVHVYPVPEGLLHNLQGEGDCNCNPEIIYIDSDTGIPFPSGPLVIHQCFLNRPYAIETPDLIKKFKGSVKCEE